MSDPREVSDRLAAAEDVIERLSGELIAAQHFLFILTHAISNSVGPEKAARISRTITDMQRMSKQSGGPMDLPFEALRQEGADRFVQSFREFQVWLAAAHGLSSSSPAKPTPEPPEPS